MEVRVLGLSSGYEIEQLVRVFFPGATPRKGPSSKGDLLLAAARPGRLVAAVRMNGVCTVRTAPAPGVGGLDEATPEEPELENPKPGKPGKIQPPTDSTFAPTPLPAKTALSRLVYDVLCQATGLRPPWGMLTGVRPVGLYRKRAAKGGDKAARGHLVDVCDVSEGKFAMLREIDAVQRPVLAQATPESVCLYVSIPFCPTRCDYCSFVSRTVEREGHLVEPYLNLLEQELAQAAEAVRENGLALRAVYIGGGTPTALDENQLERLLRAVQTHFGEFAIPEYTLEAGRPDCTTPEKLRLAKEYGVGRVSVNPQSMDDTVLRAIGRGHTAAEIIECYGQARRIGFDSINMDLIAGLPGDSLDGFQATLDQVLALGPENVTVHTLTLKRASNLAQDGRQDASTPGAMVGAAYPALRGAGYKPYYLYRQKNTVDNLENTGWAVGDKIGLYNIHIMEEKTSILAVGAGAVTKLVAGGGAAIQRLYNPKFPADYIKDFEKVTQKRKEVSAFYARHLDSQTSG